MALSRMKPYSLMTPKLKLILINTFFAWKRAVDKFHPRLKDHIVELYNKLIETKVVQEMEKEYVQVSFKQRKQPMKLEKLLAYGPAYVDLGNVKKFNSESGLIFTNKDTITSYFLVNHGVIMGGWKWSIDNSTYAHGKIPHAHAGKSRIKEVEGIDGGRSYGRNFAEAGVPKK